MKNYLFLLSSRTLSIFSNSLLFFTLLKIIELYSGADFNLYYLVYYLPIFLFAFLVGTFIDGQVQQKVIFIVNIIHIVIIACMLLTNTAVTGDYIFIYTFLFALCSLFIGPSTQSLLKKVSTIEDRTRKNAVFQMTQYLFKMVGQISAAYFIANNLSLNLILIIMAIFYLFSAVTILFVQPFEKSTKVNQKLVKNMVDGIKSITSRKNMLKLFLIYSFIWILASSFDLILLSYITEILGGNSELLGYFGASSVIGIVIGSIFADKFYKKYSLQISISISLFILLALLIMMTFIDSMLLMMMLFSVQGSFLGIFIIGFTTYLQNNADDNHVNKVFSVYYMLQSGCTLPGVLIFSALINEFSFSTTLLIIAFFVAVLLVFVSIVNKEKFLISSK